VRQRLDVTRLVGTAGVVAPASVLIEDGQIRAAGTPASVGDAGVEATRIDATLVPGFVDLQVNGIGGIQYGIGDDGLTATASSLLAAGVTAHCPTITTREWSHYPAAFASLGDGPTGPAPRNLGLHLEGPFLSASRAGAHDAAAMREPTVALAEELVNWAGHNVAIVTLAPERPGALEVIVQLQELGIVVSAGHTDATFEQMGAAVDAGLSMVTHVFNAQRGLGHREPGVAGAALRLEGLTVGIILDGHHVHPDVALLVLEAAAGRCFAVTDAIATAGLPPGLHEFAGMVVDTSSGAPRLPNGVLAGSNLTMDAAFRFVASRCGLVEAVAATAAIPARAVGHPELAAIEAGTPADFVALDDDMAVVAVWVDGQQVP